MSVPPVFTDPTLTSDQLIAITHRAFGDDVVLREAVPVGGGSVNEVWRLGVPGQRDTILRVAPSAEAAASGPSWLTDEGLRREQAAIALLLELVDILPRTVFLDTTRTIVPRDWVVQGIMPGVPWSEIDDRLTDEERASLWHQLWSICRIIHSVHGPGFGPAHDPHFATLADVLLNDAQGLLADARRYGLPEDGFLRLIAIIERVGPSIDRSISESTLVHSDLGTRHCFVQQDEQDTWQIVGLIDWEFARFADAFAETVFTDGTSSGPDVDAYGIVEPIAIDGVLRTLYDAIARGWEATDCARIGQLQESAGPLMAMEEALDVIDAKGILLPGLAPFEACGGVGASADVIRDGTDSFVSRSRIDGVPRSEATLAESGKAVAEDGG